MRLPAALLLLGAVVLASVPVAAQDVEGRLTEIEQEIRRLNGRIGAQQGERVEIQKDLAATEARLEEVRGLLADAQNRLAGVETSISEAEHLLVDLRNLIAQLKRELAEIRLTIRDTRQLVRDRAVELYMQAGSGIASLVFTTADVSEVELGIQYAEEVVADSEALINSLEILRRQEEEHQAAVELREADTEEVLADLQDRRRELESYRAEVESRRRDVEAELENGRVLLARVNAAIAEIEGELTALEKESAQLEAELAARQSAEGDNPGALGWPAAGPVVSGFGYRIHPIFGTRKLHTGIDVDAASGAPITASESGVVILARTYGGYGRTIVVDHGGGLSTLYAHQSSLLVSEGSRVARGEVIGYVGCSGYCTGPHLHFETREWGKPVDPMKYLS